MSQSIAFEAKNDTHSSRKQPVYLPPSLWRQVPLKVTTYQTIANGPTTFWAYSYPKETTHKAPERGRGGGFRGGWLAKASGMTWRSLLAFFFLHAPVGRLCLRTLNWNPRCLVPNFRSRHMFMLCVLCYESETKVLVWGTSISNSRLWAHSLRQILD